MPQAPAAASMSAEPMALCPGCTALIVVDMQNAFLDPQGSCARLGLDYEALRAAIPGVQKLIGAARKFGMPIVYTRYCYRPDYLDGGIVTEHLLPGLREAGALISGTWDTQIVPELTTLKDDIVVDKNRPSAFHGTPLEMYLNGLDVNGIIVCGVTTNICVEATVREAMQRDFRVWVVANATAEFEPDRHTVALKGMGWMFASIVDLERALEEIPRLVTDG
jgi:ureidoacrylate peracid hydrolase